MKTLALSSSASTLRLADERDAKKRADAEKPQPTYFDVRFEEWKQRVEAWWPNRRR